MTDIAPARLYRNHHLDNTRWRAVATRPGDIVVATPYKCGTTWTQTIVLHLLHQDLTPRPLRQHSPWIEFRPDPLEDLTARLAALPGRRCLKSHMPFDGMPYDPGLRYVVVGRDPRDVFMSLWNHYSNYTDAAYARLNDGAEALGGPLPRCPDDIRAFWAQWIGSGWFAWEREGWPFWANMRHVQSWWDRREADNIVFVHYDDLLARPAAEIARLAQALDIACSPDMAAAIAVATRFASMKRNARTLVGHNVETFRGGPDTFIHKGVNGRWRTVLTADDLALYDATAAAVLTPDCRQWLQGGAAA